MYYEYYCNVCRKGVAVNHGMNEDFKTPCEHCGTIDWQQVYFPPALKFTGSGFYETDYKKKGK